MLSFIKFYTVNLFIPYFNLNFLCIKAKFSYISSLSCFLHPLTVIDLLNKPFQVCFSDSLPSMQLLYQLFRFVSPALYADERKYAVRVVGGGYVTFMLGVMAGYYLIFPLTLRFLGTYQVAGDVTNMISLQSYMGTLMTMSLAMGVVFEMPVLCWLFGKLGFITDGFMRKYRKHAIVIIIVVAAVITPTSDVITLTIVSIPMWILYEISIFLVKPKKKH